MNSIYSSVARVARHKGVDGLIRAVAAHATIAVCRDVLKIGFLKRRIHDYRMNLDLNDPGISRTLLLFGSREEEHRKILLSVLKPGMTIFDIGANIGYYVLMELGLIGEEGRVLAIEPSPRNISLLRRNLDLNGYENVSVRQMGVSDASGVRKLMMSTMTNLNTFHSDGSEDRLLSGEVVDVETATVPQLAAEFGAPDLLRMDVEGHEVEILNGLVPAIESGELKPMILFETHRGTYTADHDIAVPLKRLFDAGYAVPYIASATAGAAKNIQEMGYETDGLFPTDFEHRAIFKDVAPQHLLDLLSGAGGVRTILLGKS